MVFSHFCDKKNVFLTESTIDATNCKYNIYQLQSKYHASGKDVQNDASNELDTDQVHSASSPNFQSAPGIIETIGIIIDYPLTN